MNRQEVEIVADLSVNKRYAYFIKRVADFEELWGLHNGKWATATDDAGRMLVPLWPAEEFARMCAVGSWEDCQPKKIELDKFMGNWLPGMQRDGYVPAIFGNNKNSAVVEVDVLMQDLRRELEKYE